MLEVRKYCKKNVLSSLSHFRWIEKRVYAQWCSEKVFDAWCTLISASLLASHAPSNEWLRDEFKLGSICNPKYLYSFIDSKKAVLQIDLGPVLGVYSKDPEGPNWVLE